MTFYVMSPQARRNGGRCVNMFNDHGMTPYHTDAVEYPSSVRKTFHDRSDCPGGDSIRVEDREKGTGGKPRCRECIRLGLRG